MLSSTHPTDRARSTLDKLGATPAVLDLLAPALPPVLTPYHNLRELLDSLLLDFDVDHPTAVDALLHELAGGDAATEGPPQASPAARAGDTDDDARAGLPLLQPLSAREVAVLHLLGCGYTNREIALILVVTVNIVKTHLRGVYRKLGVGTRLEAGLTSLPARRSCVKC